MVKVGLIETQAGGGGLLLLKGDCLGVKVGILEVQGLVFTVEKVDVGRLIGFGSGGPCGFGSRSWRVWKWVQRGGSHGFWKWVEGGLSLLEMGFWA